MRKILVVVSALLLQPVFLEAQVLGNLPEIAGFAVDLKDEGGVEGLTQKNIEDEVTVLLRTRLPRLAFERGAAGKDTAFLGVSIGIGQLEARRSYVGYYGVVKINLYRWAIIGATQRGAMVSVWHKSTILTGPRGEARGQIREALIELFTSFASDWYRDNP